MLTNKGSFNKLFDVSRSGEKWIMGPNQKFIPVAPGTETIEHDFDGAPIGLNFNVVSENLFTRSTPTTSSGALVTEEAISIFEGKTASKITNTHETSPSVGLAQPVNIGNRPAIEWIIVESGTVAAIAFGFRDRTDAQWDDLRRLDLETGKFSRIAGRISNSEIYYGSRLLTESGPNGGKVWLCWTRIPQQYVLGNPIDAYVYPSYQTPDGTLYSYIHHRQVNSLSAGSLGPAIITEGTSATIASSLNTLTDLSFFNRNEGHFIAKYTHLEQTFTAPSSMLVLNSSAIATSENRIEIRYYTYGSPMIRIIILDGSNTLQVDERYYLSNVLRYEDEIKLGFSYDRSSIRIVLSVSSEENDYTLDLTPVSNLGSILDSIGALFLGCRTFTAASSYALNGTMSHFEYFKTSATVDEMKRKLTSL